MRRSFAKDDVNFQESEWFLARITALGSSPGGSCDQVPYEWEQLDYCSNGKSVEVIGVPDNFGTLTVRQAYAIDPNGSAAAGDVVLMRLRGTFNGETIYEFVTAGGGSQPSTSCFGLKSVSCSNGILMATMADAGGCANCSSGVALYELTTMLTVNNATATAVPNNWTLIFGDLGDCGLAFNGDTFENTFGAELKLKVTYQVGWSTDTSSNVTSRGAYILRDNVTSDSPVSNFIAAAKGHTVQVATNTFTLANGQYFQPWVYQNGGGTRQIADPADDAPTTIYIERLCT